MKKKHLSLCCIPESNTMLEINLLQQKKITALWNLHSRTCNNFRSHSVFHLYPSDYQLCCGYWTLQHVHLLSIFHGTSCSWGQIWTTGKVSWPLPSHPLPWNTCTPWTQQGMYIRSSLVCDVLPPLAIQKTSGHLQVIAQPGSSKEPCLTSPDRNWNFFSWVPSVKGPFPIITHIALHGDVCLPTSQPFPSTPGTCRAATCLILSASPVPGPLPGT